MNKKISMFEIGVLNFSIIRALYMGITFSCLTEFTKQDGWFTILLSVIPLIIYILLINKFETSGKTFYQKIKNTFKKPLSTFILIIINLTILLLVIMCFFNINYFIHSQFLSKTPIYVTAIIFLICNLYVLSKDIQTLTRTAVILFIISIILFVTSALGLINLIDPFNFMPVLYVKPLNHIMGISSIISYNIFPIIILTCIPREKLENKSFKKTLIISSLLSFLSLLIPYILTIGIFGVKLSNIYEYPEFHVLKSISLIGASDKVEKILIIQWIFDMFVFVSLGIYFIRQSVEHIISINKKYLNFLFIIIILFSILFIQNYSLFINTYFMKYAHLFISIIFIAFTAIMAFKLKK